MVALSGRLVAALPLFFCLGCTLISACKRPDPEAEKPRYIGCYQDRDGHPDLPRLAGGEDLGGERVSRKVCESLCRGYESKYFGLQGGGSCYCGDAYGKYGSAEEASCDQNCRGAPEEICGGVGVNSVYAIVYK